MRGDQTMEVKLVSTLSTEGFKVITYSFKSTIYETENTIGDTLWLKLVRINHKISGYFSGDGFDWIEIGAPIDISEIDSFSDFSTFTGTRQGLYVKGMSDAWFDFYIYRDAYTPIMAECPANQFGTALVLNKYPPNSLGKIHNDDWALYAGVEFGNTEYAKSCDSLKITASCLTAGSAVEVYLDSIDVNTKIAVCAIDTTGSWTNFQTFTTDLLNPISGNHDVYLKFVGSGSGELFRLQSFQFITNSKPTAINSRPENNLPRRFYLEQNYPNPFNPVTRIKYSVPKTSYLTIKVYDVMGREVATVFDGVQQAGNYTAILDGSNLTSGIYFYKMETNGFVETKKLVLLK